MKVTLLEDDKLSQWPKYHSTAYYHVDSLSYLTKLDQRKGTEFLHVISKQYEEVIIYEVPIDQPLFSNGRVQYPKHIPMLLYELADVVDVYLCDGRIINLKHRAEK